MSFKPAFLSGIIIISLSGCLAGSISSGDPAGPLGEADAARAYAHFCTAVYHEYHRQFDEAVADFFDAQVDAGRKPEQFARVLAETNAKGFQNQFTIPEPGQEE